MIISSLHGNVEFSGTSLGHRGEAVVGPFTSKNWNTPQSVTVTAILNYYAESSKLQQHLNMRYRIVELFRFQAAHIFALFSLTAPSGDDKLSVVGLSYSDKRYDTLQGSNITVLIASFEAGLQLT